MLKQLGGRRVKPQGRPTSNPDSCWAKEIRQLINKPKNMDKENLLVAYGSRNITINKGENHIILDKEEVAFLIKSLLSNMKIEEITIY